MTRRILSTALISAVAAAAVLGIPALADDPTPTATATASASATAIPTDTPVPTVIAADTPTPAPTQAPTQAPTDTATPTDTPAGPPTETPAPTETQTAAPEHGHRDDGHRADRDPHRHAGPQAQQERCQPLERQDRPGARVHREGHR